MFYLKQNLPWWERVVRVIVGLAGLMLATASGLPTGGVALWSVIAAAVLFACTGFIGFCPACALFGRRPTERVS